MGEEWKRQLDALKQGGLYTLKFTEEQQNEFNKLFSALFLHAHTNQNDEMSSSVARMAVNICRIATIVGLLRGDLTPDAELSADNLKDGIVTRWDIHLSPADFKAVIGLVEPLYIHAAHILSFLPPTEINRRTNADRDSFFNGMPPTFSRAELLEHATETGINANTAQSWLHRLLKHGAVQEMASKGHYRKPDAMQRGQAIII